MSIVTVKLTEKELQVTLDALSNADIEMFAPDSSMTEDEYEKAVEAAEAKMEEQQ